MKKDHARLNRRDVLIQMSLGTAGMLWCPRNRAAPTRLKVGDVTELAELFRRTPRNEVLVKAADAIQAGADTQTLLGAAFVAGVHDIRPRSVGGKLHAVMMVESAFQLSAGASEEEARLVALWSVDDFKNSQERDVNEGDWILPPRPDVSFSSEGKARRELVEAMESWDTERADRAIVGLLPFHRRASLFEILWPFAARSYVDIGHKIIFCAQVERVLGRLGWRHAEPALRSLVNGLLYLDDSISGSETNVFDRSRELAPAMPDAWLAGHEDPEESATLLRRWRECDPPQAQDVVLAAFKDGLGPRTVWDGLRLYASELLHRRPPSAARRHGPVHPVTEVNAFAYVWRTTDDETTKRLMVLQAAAWLPLLRRDLQRFFGPMEGEGVDVLGTSLESSAPSLREVFEEPSPAGARVRLDQEPKGISAFLDQVRGHLTHKAFQSHQYKYAAAIREESALVHPRWASRILAPSVTYLPSAVDPDTEVLRRSLHALRRAGVG